MMTFLRAPISVVILTSFRKIGSSRKMLEQSPNNTLFTYKVMDYLAKTFNYKQHEHFKCVRSNRYSYGTRAKVVDSLTLYVLVCEGFYDLILAIISWDSYSDISFLCGSSLFQRIFLELENDRIIIQNVRAPGMVV